MSHFGVYVNILMINKIVKPEFIDHFVFNINILKASKIVKLEFISDYKLFKHFGVFLIY